ncbi:MAG: pentapeptide repeat-containing protein [Planctomycetota bacterium]
MDRLAKSALGKLKRGARVEGGELRAAVVRGETIACADFRGVDLSGTQFAGCELAQASFADATLAGTQFEDCALVEADFSGALGHEARFERCVLPGARFAGADFFQAQFQSCELSAASFRDVRAVNIDFEESRLARADFTGADLAFSTFLTSDVSGGTFRNANLSGAGFCDVDLEGCGFLDARIEGMDVSGSGTRLGEDTSTGGLSDLFEILGLELARDLVAGVSGRALVLAREEGGVFGETTRIEGALRAFRVPFRVAGAARFEEMWELITVALGKGYLALAPVAPYPQEITGEAYRKAAWVVLHGVERGQVFGRTTFSSRLAMDREELSARWEEREGETPLLAFIVGRAASKPDGGLTGEALRRAWREAVEKGLPFFEAIAQGLGRDPEELSIAELRELTSERIAESRRSREGAARYLEELARVMEGVEKKGAGEAASCYRSAAAGLARLGEILPRYVGTSEGGTRKRALAILADNRKEAQALMGEIVREERSAGERLGESVRASQHSIGERRG